MSGSCFHPRIQFAFYRLFRPLADKYMLAMIHWTLHVMMLQPILGPRSEVRFRHRNTWSGKRSCFSFKYHKHGGRSLDFRSEIFRFCHKYASSCLQMTKHSIEQWSPAWQPCCLLLHTIRLPTMIQTQIRRDGTYWMADCVDWAGLFEYRKEIFCNIRFKLQLFYKNEVKADDKMINSRIPQIIDKDT